MSNGIKDLYDYDLVKTCFECEIISLKSNFHKDKTKNEGLKANCVFCRKKLYLENRARIASNRKIYNKKNRDKTNTRLKQYSKKKKRI